MPVPVLIISPIRSFGQLIQQALHEIGSYQAILVSGGIDALERAATEKFALVVLDSGLDDMDLVELVHQLREINPDMKFLGITLGDQAGSQNETELNLDVLLPKPFYLPDLISALDELAGDIKIEPKEKAPRPSLPDSTQINKSVTRRPAPAWLENINRAAQHLTRLSLESAAQAALIATGNQLWAYAGQLPQPAAEELAQFVGHYWEHDGVNDFARFIRLESNGSEYMLYATGLGGEFVLALAFETEMPFSEMRAQAGQLARRLTDPPKELTVEPVVETAPVMETPAPTSPQEWHPEEQIDPIFPADWRPDQALAAGRQSFLEELLSTMEVPEPDVLGNASLTRVKAELDQELETALQKPVDSDSPTQVDKPDLNFLVDTRPSPVSDNQEGEIIQPSSLAESDLEPTRLALHNLAYASVLIPRMPKHHLIGDLASALNEWIPQLCLAFGWRLEHISIRPDYVHWVASVPPVTSPNKMIRILRRHSSERIFKEFPRLAQDNPSGDFWTLGYLVMNGSQPTAASLIQEFVEKNRNLQGVSNQKPKPAQP